MDSTFKWSEFNSDEPKVLEVSDFRPMLDAFRGFIAYDRRYREIELGEKKGNDEFLSLTPWTFLSGINDQVCGESDTIGSKNITRLEPPDSISYNGMKYSRQYFRGFYLETTQQYELVYSRFSENVVPLVDIDKSYNRIIMSNSNIGENRDAPYTSVWDLIDDDFVTANVPDMNLRLSHCFKLHDELMALVAGMIFVAGGGPQYMERNRFLLLVVITVIFL